MFAGWQTFYQMTGGAAATLTGLLFIVVSLMAGRQSGPTQQGVALFTTPTMFHLVSVLVISGLALAPEKDGAAQCLIMIAWAIGGLAYSLTRAAGIRGMTVIPHWTDIWWYGVGPTAVYLALAGATATAWLRAPHGVYLLSLCVTALLVLTIRNAWDLVTWLAPRRDDMFGPAQDQTSEDETGS
ncbi:MAG TPA: hypothetical protein VHY32_07830 [Caulobacteraceae bacterium]|jgi:hypothetical protein|nr:hypothetical protein [Caulobacteraceae bacterium]